MGTGHVDAGDVRQEAALASVWHHHGPIEAVTLRRPPDLIQLYGQGTSRPVL
jgi:hypothetical protein